MAIEARKAEAGEPWTLAERRAYVNLPLEERRARLAAQAEQMAEHYELESERAEREAWQGGDIAEP